MAAHWVVGLLLVPHLDCHLVHHWGLHLVWKLALQMDFLMALLMGCCWEHQLEGS